MIVNLPLVDADLGNLCNQARGESQAHMHRKRTCIRFRESRRAAPGNHWQ